MQAVSRFLLHLSWNTLPSPVLTSSDMNFDTSAMVRLRSPSQPTPDALIAPFLYRSPQ